MGKYSYGDLRYKYRIKINIEELIDKIIDSLDLSYDDWYFEDSNLCIEGHEKCRYKHWHCDATRYDPPEDETELINSVDDINVEKAVLNAIEEYIEELNTPHKYISECEIDEDSYEYMPDERDDY